MKSGTINMGKECKIMYNKSREICITIHNDKKIGSKQDSIVERQHELKSTFFKMTFFPRRLMLTEVMINQHKSFSTGKIKLLNKMNRKRF